ncbi:MAG: helix-turn-helix domain-containing protein [Persicimonas sp.]
MMNIDAAGKIIRHRRKELGVDQRTLAQLADVSVHTVSDIESGKGNPTIEVLGKVLDVLGLELSIRTKFSQER